MSTQNRLIASAIVIAIAIAIAIAAVIVQIFGFILDSVSKACDGFS